MKAKTNCPNCGAPITGCVCEYCGTHFWDIADMKLNEPGYLRMAVGDRVYTFKAIPREMTLTQTPDNILYENHLAIKTIINTTLDMSFQIVPDGQFGLHTLCAISNNC